jgi:hypothetical protein
MLCFVIFFIGLMADTDVCLVQYPTNYETIKDN